MTVALAHDYLTQRGGAERVSLMLTQVFPGAPMHTSVYDPEGTYPEFRAVDIRTSPLNRIPLLRKHFRLGLPLYGWAFDGMRLDSGTDVLVVSTTGFAHGLPTDLPKVVYCHSPARFIYLPDEYLGRRWWRDPKGWPLMAIRPALRRWDQRAAASGTVYLCNSTVVRDRIRRVYGLEARVVHPPSGLDPHGDRADVPELEGWENYHVLVSRLLPYKNVDVAIEAFRGLPEERLVVVGRGPLRDSLRATLPDNVRMLEGLSDDQLREVYSRARAVVAPSHEDFGLTPVEGFSFGLPTLAFRSGGYLDTVMEGQTGYFFEAPEPEQVQAAVRRLRAEPLAPGPILDHAERFSAAAFARSLHEVVDEVRRQSR